MMDTVEMKQRRDRVKAAAHGNWPGILARLGVDEKVLNRRNQPCPLCGGTDRFQFTDKYGNGEYYCRGCGPGDGFKLLQGCLGWDFYKAFCNVEELVGVTSFRPRAAPEPSSDRMKKLAKRIWDEAKPIVAGDDVDRYLSGRGLQMPEYPRALRFHSKLGFYVPDENGKSKKVRDYPGMLAAIQGADGHAITLHRTYLENGMKAAGIEAKKVLSSGINGAAVRLSEATDELGLAEGIETALAIHLRTGKPVWATISAGNMEKVCIPDSVRRVCIYADNDANSEYDGQASAFLLARRLKKEEKRTGPRHIEVFVPKIAGEDWADVWLNHQLRKVA